MTINAALEGIRVLEVANEFGDYCGKLLAGLGADVIKVEKPGGDATRNIGPFVADKPHHEGSIYFAYYNTGKRGVTANLETADGQEIFRRLIGISDAVIETLAVGHMESLGLGYSDLRKINSRLIMASITPFGQTGPHRNWNASSEIVPFAMSGAMFQIGDVSMPPLQMGSFLVGHGVSTYAAVGILAALHNRVFTEVGEHIDISMQECAASWQENAYGTYQYPPYFITTRLGSQSPMVVPSRLYPCRDGYFYLMGGSRWNAILTWLIEEDIDVGDLVDSKYEEDEELLKAELSRVDQLIRDLGMKHTKHEMMVMGQRKGIAVTILADIKDVYEDPHLEAREYFVKMEHPVIGELRYPGAPCKFSESPWQPGRAAPLVGQHNEEIYGEIGFPRKDLAVMRANRAI